MEELYIRIQKYQRMMGYNFESMTLEERMQAFRNYMVALQIEQVELAQELPWKPWRDAKSQKHADKAVLSEEWVDSLFFLFDQALVLQLEHTDLREAFEKKMEKNLNRIKSGYNTKQGDDQNDKTTNKQ